MTKKGKQQIIDSSLSFIQNIGPLHCNCYLSLFSLSNHLDWAAFSFYFSFSCFSSFIWMPPFDHFSYDLIPLMDENAGTTINTPFSTKPTHSVARKRKRDWQRLKMKSKRYRAFLLNVYFFCELFSFNLSPYLYLLASTIANVNISHSNSDCIQLNDGVASHRAHQVRCRFNLFFTTIVSYR